VRTYGYASKVFPPLCAGPAASVDISAHPIRCLREHVQVEEQPPTYAQVIISAIFSYIIAMEQPEPRRKRRERTHL
jgi:hypothetical protein